VLAGEITFDCADRQEPLRLGPGSFFFGPRGTQHSFRNETSRDARLLVFCLPGAGTEAMFTEMDALAARGKDRAPAVEEIVAIAARYGVAIAAPPSSRAA